MQRPLLIVLAAFALVAPVAMASHAPDDPDSTHWFGVGQREPDTTEDTVGSFMWSDAPPADESRIYFNAYPTEGALRPIADPDHAADGGAGTGMNPNSGAIGTRIVVPGLQGWVAVLGVWKDCNGDGAIGIVESALLSYPATPLTVGTCAGSDHVIDGYVHELLSIGHEHLAPPGDQGHPAQIDDEDARVWGDLGRPQDAITPTCPITPLPHGTTSGTGAMIRYTDCFTNKRITGTVNANDGTGLLRFDGCANGDAEYCQNNPQESDSLLNVHFPRSLFGNPTTGEDGLLELDSNEDRTGERNYAFTAIDCESGEVDPQATPESLATGSFADAANHTMMGVQHALDSESSCDPDEENTGSTSGNNNYAGVHQAAFTIVDSPHAGTTQVNRKEQNDFFFAYFNGEPDATGTGAPTGLGTWVGQGNVEPQWQSFVVFLRLPQSVDRNTLAIQGAAYWTFYAKVGEDVLDAGYQTPGGEGRYGSEACGATFDGGTRQGSAGSPWFCVGHLDPTPSGTTTDGWCPACPAGWNIYQAPPGTTYQFRDTDCGDGEITGGVKASLVGFADPSLPNFCGDTDN